MRNAGTPEIRNLNFCQLFYPGFPCLHCTGRDFPGRKMRLESSIIGGSLAAALPVTDKYWFQQPHLLRLNLVLLVPLLSSSTFGYDGENYKF